MREQAGERRDEEMRGSRARVQEAKPNPKEREGGELEKAPVENHMNCQPIGRLEGTRKRRPFTPESPI